MVNTRKSAKSGVKSAERRKESMQTSKTTAAKSKIPKSKAAKMKKASPLPEKSSEEVSAGTSQTMDSTPQAGPQSEVNPVLSSVSTVVEKSVVDDEVIVDVENVGSLGAEARRAEIVVDKGKDVSSDVGSELVKESVSRKSDVSVDWKAKIQASGYTLPEGRRIQRKKVTRRAASPRQCLAKISSIRGRVSGFPKKGKLSVEDAPADDSAKEIGVSEGDVAEAVSKKTESSVKEVGETDAITEEPEPAKEDEDLDSVFQDIDDFVQNLQKEDQGVQTEVESGDASVPAVDEVTGGVTVATLDDLLRDHMKEEGASARKDAAKQEAKTAAPTDEDQDLVPIIKLKKTKKDKGKKKVVFDGLAEGSVADAAEVGSMAGGAGSSKKRKRVDPTPVSEDAGMCEVPSSAAVSAPVGLVKKGVWFVNKDAARKWACVQKRKIIPERLLDESRYKGKEVVEVLKESELFWTLDRCKPFNEQLVREAMVNLPPGFGSVGEAEFGVLYVRGRRIKIDPELINVYFAMDDPAVDEEEPRFEKIVSTITAGSVRWRPESVVHTADLSTFYSMLFFIAVFNWRPSTHRSTVNKDMAQLLYQIGNKLKFNLGRVMFKQIAEHATSMRTLHQICFPSLIYELIIHQAPDLLVPSDPLSKAPSKFTVDHKLFKGRHVNDLKGGSESGKGVGESSRGGAKLGVDERSKLLKDLQAIITADKEQRRRINRLARALSYPSDDESEATASEEVSIEEASD